MAKLTRLATTVTARYYPAPDITDAFFLDGRLSGKREARAADITVDKEDKGFFLSVFSHSVAPGRDPSAEPAYAAPLNKLFNEIKSGRRALDDQIGDLVNTAVSVTGRLKLQADNSRAPFFSGIIVKDSEAFAITMGKGLAFLYRDDTLFPLTATDIRIDPVNTQRQKVENFYNYCAAKTATALCSNIAQLKMDDCLLLCNREVYEALGQQELLRILNDAEDQCDAAGAAITEAAAKLPGVPLQLMISFVESVTAQEKSGLFGFGKKNRQMSYNESEDEVIEVPMAKAPAAPVPAPAAMPVPAEPLYFGNEASNPFVQPVAEQPVAPTGPEDPIHFQDQTLAPFGEPVQEPPQVDEGGFVKFEGQPAAEAPAHEETSAAFYQDSAAMPEGYQSPRFIPDEQEDEEEGEPLVFGDERSAPIEENPFVVPETASAPAGSAYQSPAQEQNAANTAGSFYIPFESKESAPTASANMNDIPDMPLYEAPTYTPPTYPSNSYTPRGYDNAGVYARGSYSSDEEPEIPRQPSQPAPANRSYSYTPPQQTVPSYGAAREGMPGQRPVPSAPGAPRASQPAAYQQQYQQPYQQTGRRSASHDMFDQEQEQDQRFDYGDSDAAYKRNRLWVFGLIGVSVICVIVLISVLIASNYNNKKTAATSQSTAAQSVAINTTPGASDTAAGSDSAPSDTAASDTSAAAVVPMCQFFFGDSTGFRTWWDVMNKCYSISISSNSDPRVLAIMEYNGLASDYVPKAGDAIMVPPMSYLPTVTPTA